MLSPVVILNSIDPHLGKVDKYSLSQCALMELFADGINNKKSICRQPDNVTDISDWRRIYLDEEDHVCNIQWFGSSLRGSVNLQWLPLTVEGLLLWKNYLTGSLRFEDLPPLLKNLQLCDNSFIGSIDLTHLPASLEILSCARNKLTGSLHLQNLPTAMSELYLSNNLFDGTVCLTHLPPKLALLHLCANDITGETDFTHIPPSLVNFGVSNTQLCGTIRLQKGMNVACDNSGVLVDRSGASYGLIEKY